MGSGQRVSRRVELRRCNIDGLDGNGDDRYVRR